MSILFDIHYRKNDEIGTKREVTPYSDPVYEPLLRYGLKAACPIGISGNVFLVPLIVGSIQFESRASPLS